MSIQIEGVSKFYGKQQVLHNINFKAQKGEIVGFLGPNGAGKSTTMKIITGFLSDFQGEVKVCDFSISNQKKAAQKKIGYLPEHNALYKNMYVREYLSFCAEIHKVSLSNIEPTLEEVGLFAEASKKIHQLSKGYQQRVGLAAALLHNPEVLILDEPTTGLDPNQLAEVRALLKKVGQTKTILLSTHILQEVEAICDRVIMIHNGNIVANATLSELKGKKRKSLEELFKELTSN